ncbi:protein MLP1 [Ostrinia furnacalis]|uniref:protein MLP1 n=1 Tax=Ostrinia furnacalis TaxID=93504 RepID=UPI00103F6D52|nr:protein MLP1 [Ostrinia furnacalis]
MGSVLSNTSAREHDADVMSESETMDNPSGSHDTKENANIDEDYVETVTDEARAKTKEEEMIEFKKQLNIKREQRKQILARHRAEKEELEKSLNSEKQSKLELVQTNKLLRELLLKHNIEIPDDLLSSSQDSDLIGTITQMKEEFESLKSNNNKLRKDLAESNNTLQNAYSDIADLNSQNIESMKQISALKEVVSVSKTMIAIREQQLNELKEKLSEIEKSLADREASMLSTDLRQEYERQLQNIRTLRGLYEERARLAEVTRVNLVRDLEEQKLLNQAEVNKTKNLSEKVKELEDKIEALIETIQNKNNQISVCQDESLGLRAEMMVVNKLFSEVLLGYKTKKDLDKLVHRLEENHGILTQMAERENDAEASTALPKLLLELVCQVDEGDEEQEEPEESQLDSVNLSTQQETSEEDLDKSSSTTAEEIVQNLPKVWRVLMELLSHQSVADPNTEEKVTTCYKSVETKSGPVLVPSVSQTYIRLKDLIVEKLALIKEVNRMKQLNSHLETRLEEQERRLCLVTTELGKTWHVVGRLRRHHHQLHTHEKILKYELQQKRKLLNELKEELEYCREKWEQAREKNTQSEKDWRKLRAEFSSRKTGSPAFNNSAESGYSDERPSDESSESNDESEYVTEPPIRCKRKLKKSFETIIDSSTDFNLAAEREDPASDMLDVADLPLDTQDESHSENGPKSEVLSEETEDEVGDITNDSYIEESASASRDHDNANVVKIDLPATSTEVAGIIAPSASQNLIDPAEILKNIKRQNERLANKDQKLENLEKNSANLLQKVKLTSKLGEQINSTLDHILKPRSSREPDSSSHHKNEEDLSITDSINDQSTQEPNTNDVEVIIKNEEIEEESNKSESANVNDTDSASSEDVSQCSETQSSSSVYETPNTSTVDFKAILENVKKQDERLVKKDQRFENLEKECSKVIDNINHTLHTGQELSDKLETLHNVRGEGVDVNEIANEDTQGSKTEIDDQEPSTSSDIDHEARFAARDIRLKRLEEQTKCLVNKVNKTTSKGVKIHYKLEELHNIYGSESSRAGTPSEESEDKNEEEEIQNEQVDNQSQ